MIHHKHNKITRLSKITIISTKISLHQGSSGKIIFFEQIYQNKNRKLKLNKKIIYDCAINFIYFNANRRKLSHKKFEK